MSLEAVHAGRLFDDATTDAERRLYYVRSGELGIDPRADVELMTRLRDERRPQRVQIVGPSGAGKTSLIVRVLADLAAQNASPAHEVLILKIGDNAGHLDSGANMIKLVLDTVVVGQYRFSNIDPTVFEEAGAESVSSVPPRVNHEFGFDGKIANYKAKVEEAYRTLVRRREPTELRQTLEAIVALVAEHGYRPVLVLDDTEKFVSPGPDGLLQEREISNLYHHGVRVLGELDLDLVIAMHPRFEEVNHVREVVDRLGIDQIQVPRFVPDQEPLAVAKVLARRLERGGVEVPLSEVIGEDAIGDLQLLYHERDANLRSVLKIAHAAVEHALERGSGVLEPLDVRSVVAA
jgi:hypothetical protein